MRFRLTVLAVMAVLMVPGFSSGAELENYIQVKGESNVIVKPDVAHCFMIVSGSGGNYDASNKAANDKLDQLSSLLKTTLRETPQLTILKVENKPKTETFDEKQYFTEMAKAMKGETPGQIGPAKKEMSTHIMVYFSLSKFTRESIQKLMNSLVEKEIAFDKSSRFDFDFPSEFTFNKSAIYFGLLSPDKHLETLAVEAFKKAEHDAKIIASSVKKKMVGLVNVTGCGDMLEGNVTLPYKSNLTGKDLGPLTSDPARLMIRFSKDYGFKIE
jgi:hypothetical protein